MKPTPRLALAALLVPLILALSACDPSLPRPRSTGSASGEAGDFQPNAGVPVVNDGNTRFDQEVKNAIADVQAFWRTNYPRVSGGKPYPELRGGIYSVDGSKIPRSLARSNACLRQDPTGAQNNAFYCTADDSVVYDRNPDHLVAQLGEKYGSFIITAVIAHEWGHAIQQRLGIFDSGSGASQAGPATILTETQADCASGAFISTAQNGQTAHVSVTQQELERTLLGYLQVRDPPPVSVEQISHGNGFDRLSAMADGIANGVSFCFGQEFQRREFTERPFTSDIDYLQRGNLPYAQIIDPTPDSPDQSSLQDVLNSFWTDAAASVDKSWNDVRVQQTSEPNCPDVRTSEFDYCPSGNFVYFSDEFARQAYNSLPDKRLDKSTGRVTLTDNAPADYSLGTLFVYGWSMAVRSQLFRAPVEGKDALLDASCYSGAFTAAINTGQSQGFRLSPPDMDEATSAVIKLVPAPEAYGAQETTALQRIQRFTQGYFGGLAAC
ncbi:neutral zinc metallopeptidase [Jatrophihabitans sp.]|uniref:neutral zinc metallopeptidase n=1 Tax=Jatrophihabitans sp. TaxID=1932789 RepID=UPI002F099797